MKKIYLFLMLLAISLSLIFIALQYGVGSLMRQFIGVTSVGILAYLFIMLLEGLFWFLGRQKSH